MHGSRKFSQRGSKCVRGFFGVFLVDKGRKDPNTTISGPSFARQLVYLCWPNAGLIAM